MDVAELTAETRRLLGVDRAALPPAELHRLAVDAVRLLSSVSALATEVVAEWDAQRVWEDDGSKSAGCRLGRDAGCDAETTKTIVWRGRRLRTMPLTLEAYRSGSLSTDHVDVLCRANRPEVASLFARDERTLVEPAATLTFDDFKIAVSHWRNIADDEGAEDDAQRRHERRYLRSASTLDGVVDVQGRLSPIDGAIFQTELFRLEQQMFEADWAAARAEHGDAATERHLARTSPQRRADALIEMARRSAAMAADAKPARPLITILCGYETFAGRVCQLADGTVLTPGQVASVLGEADIERVVFDSPSRVIDVGRRSRFFTGALKRAIEVRDRHCTHPGCTVPAARCQIDHIVEFCDGGPTTQANGRLLCPAHNRRRPGRASPPADGP